MSQSITINGRAVELTWNNETKKRFAFRLQSIGGHPSNKLLSRAATAPAAYAKILWALLPKDAIGDYDTPEDLFVAIDQDNEGSDIAKAIAAIYGEMAPTDEKKSTGAKSHSPESNSD
jgi:hypothetical protein